MGNPAPATTASAGRPATTASAGQQGTANDSPLFQNSFYFLQGSGKKNMIDVSGGFIKMKNAIMKTGNDFSVLFGIFQDVKPAF
ncbi:MAG: hypothetical protein L6420_10795 [Elusimicrobia bacterium]|nr:hypothetical protein [Elusimicrobiota bacterium]